MNKEKLQSLNKWLIVFLVVLQPIVDIIRKTIVHDIQFLGFSMFEMLNLIIIILSLIISIYLYKDKKYFKRFLIIIPVFLIYAIFHYINMLKLNTSVYENLNISFLVETYYLFRVFMIPLLLIISMLYSDIKKDTYIRVVEIMALIISSVIVISNIFLFGYPAYDVDNYVHNNIFGWFFFNSKSYYDYYNITSRGLFNSGNQIASVLFMISPIIIYQAYKKRSIFNYALLVLTSISMLMVGTKIANVGIILVFLTFIVIFFFFKLLDKKSYSIKPILYIFIFIAFLFCFSPVSHNLRYIMKGGKSLSKVEVLGQNKNPSNQNISEDNKQEYENFIEIQKYDCNNLTDIQIKKIINFYKKSSSFIGLSSFITENYNVDKHTKFWCDYIKNYNGSDYRELKTSIYENIKRENNNWFDNLFGLGHTLNFIYTEEDYTYQLYSYGLIGFIVLLGPYFIFILFMFFKILKNYKKKFNIESVVYLMSPIIAMCAAYFSGYMFETTMTLITVALIIVLNLISLEENRTLSKKVLLI